MRRSSRQQNQGKQKTQKSLGNLPVSENSAFDLNDEVSVESYSDSDEFQRVENRDTSTPRQSKSTATTKLPKPGRPIRHVPASYTSTTARQNEELEGARPSASTDTLPAFQSAVDQVTDLTTAASGRGAKKRRRRIPRASSVETESDSASDRSGAQRSQPFLPGPKLSVSYQHAHLDEVIRDATFIQTADCLPSKVNVVETEKGNAFNATVDNVFPHLRGLLSSDKTWVGEELKFVMSEIAPFVLQQAAVWRTLTDHDFARRNTEELVQQLTHLWRYHHLLHMNILAYLMASNEAVKAGHSLGHRKVAVAAFKAEVAPSQSEGLRSMSKKLQKTYAQHVKLEPSQPRHAKRPRVNRGKGQKGNKSAGSPGQEKK